MSNKFNIDSDDKFTFNTNQNNSDKKSKPSGKSVIIGIIIVIAVVAVIFNIRSGNGNAVYAESNLSSEVSENIADDSEDFSFYRESEKIQSVENIRENCNDKKRIYGYVDFRTSYHSRIC